MKRGKVNLEKENPDEAYKQMLEFYTMVPPKPAKTKKTRQSGNKKASVKK